VLIDAIPVQQVRRGAARNVAHEAHTGIHCPIRHLVSFMETPNDEEAEHDGPLEPERGVVGVFAFPPDRRDARASWRSSDFHG
jgi:hypothetical protein